MMSMHGRCPARLRMHLTALVCAAWKVILWLCTRCMDKYEPLKWRGALPDSRVAARCAGILSSYGELDHMARGCAELRPFNPFDKMPKMSYKVRSCHRSGSFNTMQCAVDVCIMAWDVRNMLPLLVRRVWSFREVLEGNRKA